MVLADFALPYEAQKRSAATSRDATLAQNAYSRFLSQQRGARQLADLDRGMTAGIGKMSSTFGRRGLANSGIFARAQNDYSQNWMQQRQDVNDSLLQAMRQLDFGDRNAWASYETTVADAEAQKQADILATAASLQQMRPFLGS